MSKACANFITVYLLSKAIRNGCGKAGLITRINAGKTAFFGGDDRVTMGNLTLIL